MEPPPAGRPKPGGPPRRFIALCWRQAAALLGTLFGCVGLQNYPSGIRELAKLLLAAVGRRPARGRGTGKAEADSLRILR